ncbi:MAG: alpha/beta hydrolase [Candidatus Dormibacteria bacterium]
MDSLTGTDAEVRRAERRLGLGGWLEGWRQAPPDTPVGEGLTVGTLLPFLDRPATPAGSVYRSWVTYGTAGAEGRPLHMCLYARADISERRPGVLFIHGGGWAGLDPFVQIRNAALLAAEGYVTATVEYRLAGEATWPAALQDCKCALRWMRRHAHDIGLDTMKIGAAGNSAGGHLAAMLALTPGAFEGEGGNAAWSSRIDAAFLMYPALDMLHPAGSADLRAGFVAFMGGDDVALLRAGNPPSYLTASCPPFFTVTGDQDDLTTVASIRSFHDRLDELGVDNQLVVYPGAGHVYDLNPSLWTDQFDRMVTFFARALAASPLGS